MGCHCLLTVDSKKFKCKFRKSKDLVTLYPVLREWSMNVAQSRPTLCNPHGLYNSWNSPGLACSNCSRNNWKVKSLSHVRLFATPWTVAYHALPSEVFSRREYWSGLPFPSPGDLHNPGIKSGSPTLQADALPSEPPGKLK